MFLIVGYDQLYRLKIESKSEGLKSWLEKVVSIISIYVFGFYFAPSFFRPYCGEFIWFDQKARQKEITVTGSGFSSYSTVLIRKSSTARKD